MGNTLKSAKESRVQFLLLFWESSFSALHLQPTFRCLLNIFSCLLWKGWDSWYLCVPWYLGQSHKRKKIEWPNPWAVLTSESLCSWGVYSKCERTLFVEQRWGPVNPFLSYLMNINLQLQPPVRCKCVQDLLKSSERCPHTSVSDIYWHRHRGWQAGAPVYFQMILTALFNGVLGAN